MSCVDIEPACNDTLGPDDICPTCKLSPSDQVIYDADHQVDEVLLNVYKHKHFEKICDRLPHLLTFSVPYFLECGRRCVWVALYQDVYTMMHEPSLVMMTREMVAPFHRDLTEGAVNVMSLIDSYDPHDSIVVWIRVCNGVSIVEDNQAPLRVDDDDEEEEEIVDEEDKPEAYANSYSMACIISIQAVAKAKELHMKQKQ